ncbi:MAG: hypothetical protein IJM88_00935 [Bacteroidales bacterium]|nr:hypothetical protein [Bacteroidales bacterium]
MKKALHHLLWAALLALPFVSQAQNNLTVSDGSDSNMYIPFLGFMADCDQHIQMIYPADSIDAMDGYSIKKMVFYVATGAPSESFSAYLGTWTISLGETTATTLSAINTSTTLSQVYDGEFDCSTGILTINFDNEYAYNGGNLLIDITHDGDGEYKTWFFRGTTLTGAAYIDYTDFLGDDHSDSKDFLPKVTFNYGAPTTCFPVTGLAVTAATATSLTLGWSDTTNSGATYTLLDLGANSVVATGISGTSYTVSGLSGSTTYTFGLVTNCSATDASDTATLIATTDCTGGSCLITILAQDEYGDGWGDMDPSYLVITQGANVVASYSMPSQDLYETTIYDTFQVSVCGSMPVTFSWVSGGDYSYDDEVSFTILDGSQTSVYTISDASDLGSNFFTLNSACPTSDTAEVVTLTLTVNNLTMGTTNPTPGTYYFTEGQQMTATALPNEGYIFTGWHVTAVHPDLGQVYDTILNLPSGFLQRTAEDYMIGLHVTVMALFSDGEAPVDSTITVTYTVNDPTMGSVNPSGTFELDADDMINVTATANDGYEFRGWGLTVEVMDFILFDTTILTSIPYLYEEVDEDMLGTHLTIAALFGPTDSEGIDAFGEAGISLYSQRGTIMLSGAQGRDVQLYDLSGRLLYHTAQAQPNERYSVPTTGLYLLHIEGIGTRRIVVVR